MQTTHLLRNLTLYLAAWLCLSGFFVPFSLASKKAEKVKIRTGNPCFPPAGKFCTYDQIQYGTANSPASSLLATHFPSLFPNGIAIGADVYLNVDGLLCSVLGLLGGLLDTVLNLVFTTVDDVIAFLPQRGIPGAIIENLIDPVEQLASGALAGNALALALNIALDVNIATFGATNACNLTDLYVVRGPCAGLSVAAVLNVANQILGNTCPLPLLGKAPLTIAANVNLCLANINNNFLAAAAANQYLALPGLNLQAILDVCLNLPAITAGIDATVVVSGNVVNAPLNVQLHVGASLLNFKGWKMGASNLPVSSPIPLDGFLLPLPSVVGGLLGGVLSLVGNLLDVVLDDGLCLVNYLLNNKPFHASLFDIQAAILLLLNPGLTIQALFSLGVPCNPSIVAAILADVRLNGIGFVPAPGQVVAVVANLKVAGVAARVLLELEVPAVGLNLNSALCIAL